MWLDRHVNIFLRKSNLLTKLILNFYLMPRLQGLLLHASHVYIISSKNLFNIFLYQKMLSNVSNKQPSITTTENPKITRVFFAKINWFFFSNPYFNFPSPLTHLLKRLRQCRQHPCKFVFFINDNDRETLAFGVYVE